MRTWVIELPLPGRPDEWWEVCRCDSAGAVASVLSAILDASDDPPVLVRVRETVPMG
jgi:hypothetical protein